MRTHLIRDPFWPYHVTTRSNNKEWFQIPTARVWEIVSRRLEQTTTRYDIWVHAFVLMSNHFHLMVSAPQCNLDRAIRFLKTEVSRDIGLESGRINHIFGGRYRWSWLADPTACAYVYKYVLRNPVRARMVSQVEEYAFGSLNGARLPLVERIDETWSLIPKDFSSRLNWLNKPTPKELEALLSQAAVRKQFGFSKQRTVFLKERKLRESYFGSERC